MEFLSPSQRDTALKVQAQTERPTGSSYQQLLWEMANSRGIFEKPGPRGGSKEEVYVPPWRRTMSEVYGVETAIAMKKQPENYEQRARRFALEEAERRRGGTPPSRAAAISALPK